MLNKIRIFSKRADFLTVLPSPSRWISWRDFLATFADKNSESNRVSPETPIGIAFIGIIDSAGWLNVYVLGGRWHLRPRKSYTFSLNSVGLHVQGNMLRPAKCGGTRRKSRCFRTMDSLRFARKKLKVIVRRRGFSGTVRKSRRRIGHCWKNIIKKGNEWRLL